MILLYIIRLQRFLCQLYMYCVDYQIIGEYLLCTGADCRARDAFGKCPFDYIRDTEEWMDSGYFSEEVRARLKGTSNTPLFSHDYMVV